MSQAKVDIAQSVPGMPMRLVTVTGTPDQIQMAQYLIQVKMGGGSLPQAGQMAAGGAAGPPADYAQMQQQQMQQQQAALQQAHLQQQMSPRRPRRFFFPRRGPDPFLRRRELRAGRLRAADADAAADDAAAADAAAADAAAAGLPGHGRLPGFLGSTLFLRLLHFLASLPPNYRLPDPFPLRLPRLSLDAKPL